MIYNLLDLFWMVWAARFGVPPDVMLSHLRIARYVGNQIAYTKIMPHVK